MSTELFERLKAELTGPPFNAWLRPEPISATEDGVEIHLPVRPEMAGGTEPAFVHGGIIAALIDMAGYAAGACATGRKVPTIALQIDFLRLAIADVLQAKATVRHKSQKLARVDVEVSAAGKVVALGRGTFKIQEYRQ